MYPMKGNLVTYDVDKTKIYSGIDKEKWIITFVSSLVFCGHCLNNPVYPRLFYKQCDSVVSN